MDWKAQPPEKEENEAYLLVLLRVGAAFLGKVAINGDQSWAGESHLWWRQIVQVRELIQLTLSHEATLPLSLEMASGKRQ